LYITTLPVLLFPGFIDRWSHKNAVFAGSLGFVFTFLAGTITTTCAENKSHFWCQNIAYIYSLNILCAIINGFFSGILWISVNRYITACSNKTNEGRFMGVFFALLNCSNVTGNLVAAFILKHFGQFHFYLTACAISCLAMIMMYFAPEVSRYDEKESEHQHFKEKFWKIIKLSYSPRMRTFLLFLAFVGIIFAISAGFEYKIVLHAIPDMSKEDQNAITALVFVIQGLVTIVFSYIVGGLADKFKVYYVINAALMTNFIAITFSFLAYYKQSLALAYFMSGFWGLAFASMATLTGTVMMKDFNGSLESFALQQLLNNFATVLGYGICIWVTDVTTFLYVILGLLIVTQMSTLLYKSPQKYEISKE